MGHTEWVGVSRSIISVVNGQTELNGVRNNV